MAVFQFFANELGGVVGLAIGFVLNLMVDPRWSPVVIQFFFELLAAIGSDYNIRAPTMKQYISRLKPASEAISPTHRCWLCRERLAKSNPRQLPCGHVLCADCIEVTLRRNYTDCWQCGEPLYDGPKPDTCDQPLAGHLQVFSQMGLRVKAGSLLVQLIDWVVYPTRPDMISIIGLLITIYCIALDMDVLSLEHGDLGPLSSYGRTGRWAYLILMSFPNWWCFSKLHFIVLFFCHWLRARLEIATEWNHVLEPGQVELNIRRLMERSDVWARRTIGSVVS